MRPRAVRNGDAGSARGGLPTGASSCSQCRVELGLGDLAGAQRGVEPIRKVEPGKVEARSGGRGDQDSAVLDGVYGRYQAPHHLVSGSRNHPSSRRYVDPHHLRRSGVQPEPPGCGLPADHRVLARPQPSSPDPHFGIGRISTHDIRSRQDALPPAASDQGVHRRLGEACGQGLIAPDQALLAGQHRIESAVQSESQGCIQQVKGRGDTPSTCLTRMWMGFGHRDNCPVRWCQLDVRRRTRDITQSARPPPTLRH